MDTLTQDNSMEQQQHGSGNGISILVGFIMAIGNHIFGWLNQVHVTAQWGNVLQTIFISMVGATIGFFTNRFWHYIMDRKKSKK